MARPAGRYTKSDARASQWQSFLDEFEVQAIWLQLRHHPMPVYVWETPTDFAFTFRNRRESVLAGYFTNAILLRDFLEALEAAAIEASGVDMTRRLAPWTYT